ncbi:MAG: DUF4258 domain-containing protein [Firmicutes bacterium]|nr:DUF4258 domain-containing protein [Bacillota bacterium]
MLIDAGSKMYQAANSGGSSGGGASGGFDPNKFKFSKHALERMTQRGVSNETVAKVMQNDSFQYYHEGVWKTGYYDSQLKVFVGQAGDTITTVINNVSPQYIENLKAVVP